MGVQQAALAMLRPRWRELVTPAVVRQPAANQCGRWRKFRRYCRTTYRISQKVMPMQGEALPTV
jgi:hypothetical protein